MKEQVFQTVDIMWKKVRDPWRMGNNFPNSLSEESFQAEIQQEWTQAEDNGLRELRIRNWKYRKARVARVRREE